MSEKYSLIYADPPWAYENTISNGAAVDHYSTMRLIDLKRLPVWELAAENAVLAMWYTGTHNQEAIELAEAWGFTVRTMKGFTWVKLNQLAELRITKALADGDVTDFYDFLDLLNAETRMNGGNHTRANSEDVLIATRGAGLERKHAGIKHVGPAASHPDARPVSPADEIRRIAPLLDALSDQMHRVSIDSFQPETQRYALKRGVGYLNDIQGFPDPALYPDIAEADCRLVVMHSAQRDGIATRTGHLRPEDALDEIVRFFDHLFPAAKDSEDRRSKL